MLTPPTTAPHKQERLHTDAPPTTDFPGRRAMAWAAALAIDPTLDALILTDAKDIRYLTGIHEGIIWLVLNGGGTFAASRHMLIHEVREHARDCQILLPTAHYTPFADYDLFLSSELQRRGLHKPGFHPGKTTAQAYLKFSSNTSSLAQLTPLPDVISPLRSIKDPGELALTRQCIAIAEDAFSQMMDAGADAWIGRTERQIASELEARMCALGADRQGFPGTGIIVASGPNSASAHHFPGHRQIISGDTVLVDWGAELNGYRSDLTRTVFIGSIPAYAQLAYPLVERSLTLAASALSAGAITGDVDRIAREAITDHGYPEFYYGVGHGLGLDIHEAPWLRMDGQDTLLPDMITTIEPGIYLHGTGGIRIENMYRIRTNGSERMGSLPTALEKMVIL